MTGTEVTAKRIENFGAGRAFTATDFSDVAGRRNAANALGRLHAKGEIARAIRGVYYVQERSVLMGTEVPASADEVVSAVARANKWIVALSVDAALNALGLDTQVPAKLVYVGSGPYKRYEYGPYDIELRHRANRDLLGCSQITCAIVQALKARTRERERRGNQNARAQPHGRAGQRVPGRVGGAHLLGGRRFEEDMGGEAWTGSLGPRPASAGWSSRPPRRGWRLRRPSSRRTSGCATPWTTFSTEVASPSPWCSRAARACRRPSGSSSASRRTSTSYSIGDSWATARTSHGSRAATWRRSGSRPTASSAGRPSSTSRSRPCRASRRRRR